MLNKQLPILLLFLLSIHQVKAQSGTIGISPLLSCTLTTFTCPGVSGCCTIGGCCGSGCCANGYTCINEGTSTEACCPASDPTKCGTAASPSSSAGSGGHTCTAIENCGPDPENDDLGWTCLLGKTCGFSYGECNPCPYIAGGSSSPTTSASGSSPTFSSDTGSSPTVSSDSGSSPTTSGSSGIVPSSSSSSPKSSATRSKESGHRLYWLTTVGFGGIIGIAIYCI